MANGNAVNMTIYRSEYCSATATLNNSTDLKTATGPIHCWTKGQGLKSSLHEQFYWQCRKAIKDIANSNQMLKKKTIL